MVSFEGYYLVNTKTGATEPGYFENRDRAEQEADKLNVNEQWDAAERTYWRQERTWDKLS